VKAQKMAQHFASGSRDQNAKTDAFFDAAAQDLLAAFLLAAALKDYPITKAYYWLTRETDDEPVSILRDHDYSQMAENVEGMIFAPDRQRGGIYGVARQMANCLTSQAVLRWITPDSVVERRPQLVPQDFVQGKNTLYSLSKEGAGTAGPLVTALTVAMVEAAEDLAIEEGGRLRIPLVVMLDEAANVCKWAELPNLYSHYGSRGIVISTILQSWSQGVAVWGREGMRKLWSAANVKVYGGGVSEAQFLSELSQLIGDYTYTNISRSYSRQHGYSSNVDRDRKDRILDVADLAALPSGRAVVFASGAPAVLVKTIPWYSGEYASVVKDSLGKYDPAQKFVEDRG
jgi:conjugative transfer gene complex protein